MTGTPRRGRPRPPENIERDRAILWLLADQGPMTRNGIAEYLELSKSLTYLALSRLREQGEIRRCLQKDGSSVWSAATGEPCP